MSENRKIRMTKRVLREALVELLLVKNISMISVTELCERADINRSTFYSHYRDLIAILDELEAVFLKHVSYLNITDSQERQKQKFVEYITYVQEHKNEFLVLLDNGRMIQAVTEYSMALYEEEKRKQGQKVPCSGKHEFFVQYACVGTFQMIACWLRENSTYTVDELAQWILDLTIGIRKIEEQGGGIV